MTPFPPAVTLLTHDTQDYEQTLILFNNQAINLHTENTNNVSKMCRFAQNKYQKCVKLHIFSTSTIQYLLKKPQPLELTRCGFLIIFLRIIVILFCTLPVLMPLAETVLMIYMPLASPPTAWPAVASDISATLLPARS